MALSNAIIHSGCDMPFDHVIFEEDLFKGRKRHDPIKLVIIDDDRKDILLFEDLLRNDSDLHFSLQSFLQPDHAVYYLEHIILEEDRPDLVVMDLVMPNMNGKMLLQRFKHTLKTRDYPFIIHSSMNNYYNIEDIKNLHAAAFFEKPLNVEAFVQYVQPTGSI